MTPSLTDKSDITTTDLGIAGLNMAQKSSSLFS